jgi:lipopolysaccharide biosynthesis glycosyltransferase
MKVCLGIISIGKLYLQEFEKLFKPSVVAYCQKYGYDLKIFTDFLDPKHKHPDTISFQKCLVPSLLMDYDLVVVLDADIYIEDHAPAIHFHELHDKIGIVDEVAQSTSEGYQKLVQIGFADLPIPYYSKANFNLDTNSILNTGVMICNPKLHSEFLKSIYEKYVDTSIGHPRKFHYEQACIGYELQTNQMYTLIGNAWNFIYIHNQITKEPMNLYFLHLAGIRGSERENILTRHTSKRLIRWGIKK